MELYLQSPLKIEPLIKFSELIQFACIMTLLKSSNGFNLRKYEMEEEKYTLIITDFLEIDISFWNLKYY